MCIRDSIQRKNLAFKDQTLEEIAIANLRHLSLLQLKMFGFRPKLKNFNQALDNLASCELIGFTDTYDIFVQHCNQSFGWELTSLPPKNESPLQAKQQLSQRLLDQIEIATQREIRFYRKAKVIARQKGWIERNSL